MTSPECTGTTVLHPSWWRKRMIFTFDPQDSENDLPERVHEFGTMTRGI
jgi:hypothetical protein